MWTDDLFASLASQDPGDWNVAHELRDANLPSNLYKYRRPCDLALQNLTNGVAWCAAADTLNDPYDCGLVASPTEIFRHTTRHAPSQSGPSGFSREDFAEMCASENPLEASFEIFLRKNPETPLADIETMRADLLAQFGELGRSLNSLLPRSIALLSLSADPRSLVMWSHYADCHRGFCIEYNFCVLPPNDYRRRNLFPVVYRQERFDLVRETKIFGKDQLVAAINNMFVLASIRKSRDWEYEREWRFITVNANKEDGLIFPMPTPTRLLLGARMNAEYRNALIAVAQLRSIPCFDMRLADHSFALEPHEIHL